MTSTAWCEHWGDGEALTQEEELQLGVGAEGGIELHLDRLGLCPWNFCRCSVGNWRTPAAEEECLGRAKRSGGQAFNKHVILPFSLNPPTGPFRQELSSPFHGRRN